jgi:hypothetical protein
VEILTGMDCLPSKKLPGFNVCNWLLHHEKIVDPVL